MDITSKPSSNRPWLWVIEALANCAQIDKSTLQGIIDLAPVERSDFGENTRELVSRRSLEDLFCSASGLNIDASSSLDSRLDTGVSRSCKDVLHHIVYKVPLSSPRIAGVEIFEQGVYPFMTQKRTSSMKLELEQVLKESVIEGTHPCADLLKARSGLTGQNLVYQLSANDGKGNDLSKTNNEIGVGARQKLSSNKHSHTSIIGLEKDQHKSFESQFEQEIGIHLKEPNAANPNPTRQSVSCDKDIVDSINELGAEHPEIIDKVAERHELFSSHYLSSHDVSANTEWRSQNLCVKCDEGGQLLVCKTSTCKLKVHERCLSKSAQFDGKGNFLCPFCAYSCAVSEYLEAKKNVFVAREELCIFLGRGIEDQAMELLKVYRKKNDSSIKDKRETILVKDNGNDQVLGTAREDCQLHVNEVNNLQFERSQRQEETSTPCNNVAPVRRKTRIANNETETDSVLTGGEDIPQLRRKKGIVNNETETDSVLNRGEEIPQLCRKKGIVNNGTEELACAHYNEENVSEDDRDQHMNSRYSIRSRKHKTQCEPLLIPLFRKRQRVPWTAEEEAILTEGVRKFGTTDQQMPWKQILEFGSHVFLSERRPGDLKDKWKNICKAKQRLK